MNPLQMFCLSGVGKHSADDVVDLVGVPDELRTMRRALEQLGLQEHLAFDGDERSHPELAEDLQLQGDPGAETLLIYCTGHGTVRGGRFELLRPSGTFFNITDLTRPLEDWASLREVVLIVDACQAEPGIDAVTAEMQGVNTRLAQVAFWGVGASRRLEEASQGVFASAFGQQLRAASRASWRAAHLDPVTIANEVNKSVGPSQTVWLAARHPAERCTALPNPRYQNPVPPKALPIPPDWSARARGVATPDLPGFFFAGRTAPLAKLRESLTNDNCDPVAVTGSPGIGKTALLGQLVLTASSDSQSKMPPEVRLLWPSVPITTLGARGDRHAVEATLVRELRQLSESDTGQTLVELLHSAPKPLGIVVDIAGEASATDEWSQLLQSIRSVPGIRLVSGLPLGLTGALSPPWQVCNLDDVPAGETAEDVVRYLAQQIELAVPGAKDAEIDRAAKSLARQVGAELEVGVAVTSLPPRSVGKGTSVNDYLTAARKAIDLVAQRVARKRIAAALGDRAGVVVAALAALCSFDDSIALPAMEWAAAATTDGSAVTPSDVSVAAGLMRSLVEQLPGEDGQDRWRARFGPVSSPGQPKPQEYLPRLPQVARWQSVNWAEVDSAILLLVVHAAAAGLLSSRLLDDPTFLLDAPPSVVSKALQLLPSDRANRARRSRMWGLVPNDAQDHDRALLLRVGAERFAVNPVVAALEPMNYGKARGRWRLASRIDWVQPDLSDQVHLTRMATTSVHPNGVIVTVREDDSLAFWSPQHGRSRRTAVSLSGTLRNVTTAVVRGTPIVLASTSQREIWMIPADENSEPTLVRDLVPPEMTVSDTRRQTALMLSLHATGQVVIASEETVWLGELGSGKPAQKLATADSDLLAVQLVGTSSASAVWLVPVSGRIRRLTLGSRSQQSVTLFPVPRQPLDIAVSESGDRALILDAAGELHLRGSGDGHLAMKRQAGTTSGSVALGNTVAVVGRATATGWLEIQDLPGLASSRLPLDEPAVGLAFYGDRLLVARPSGVLSMRLGARHEG